MYIPLGFGQVNWIFTGAGYPNGAQCTLGFEHTGSDLNATEAADLFADVWIDNHITAQVNDITLATVHVKYGPNATGQEGDATVGTAGSGTGDDATPNLALLVRKVTGQGGRANRGRLYMPGLNESVFDTAGIIDSSELAIHQANWNNAYDDIISAGCTPVVLHTVLVGDQVPTPVEQFQVDGLAATQRRRMRR